MAELCFIVSYYIYSLTTCFCLIFCRNISIISPYMTFI